MIELKQDTPFRPEDLRELTFVFREGKPYACVSANVDTGTVEMVIPLEPGSSGSPAHVLARYSEQYLGALAQKLRSKREPKNIRAFAVFKAAVMLYRAGKVQFTHQDVDVWTRSRIPFARFKDLERDGILLSFLSKKRTWSGPKDDINAKTPWALTDLGVALADRYFKGIKPPEDFDREYDRRFDAFIRRTIVSREVLKEYVRALIARGPMTCQEMETLLGMCRHANLCLLREFGVVCGNEDDPNALTNYGKRLANELAEYLTLKRKLLRYDPEVWKAYAKRSSIEDDKIAKVDQLLQDRKVLGACAILASRSEGIPDREIEHLRHEEFGIDTRRRGFYEPDFTLLISKGQEVQYKDFRCHVLNATTLLRDIWANGVILVQDLESLLHNA